ncbi:hypothetical protein Ciccas_011282 [Cichlidogyrus casuarinus]|uniref:Uncharacterized protein n=1 Tax=Cichlidogyrus casuarinus TaxID=1844966 RepID=A0ABD2PRP2_9PLAT
MNTGTRCLYRFFRHISHPGGRIELFTHILLGFVFWFGLFFTSRRLASNVSFCGDHLSSADTCAGIAFTAQVTCWLAISVAFVALTQCWTSGLQNKSKNETGIFSSLLTATKHYRNATAFMRLTWIIVSFILFVMLCLLLDLYAHLGTRSEDFADRLFQTLEPSLFEQTGYKLGVAADVQEKLIHSVNSLHYGQEIHGRLMCNTRRECRDLVKKLLRDYHSERLILALSVSLLATILAALAAIPRDLIQLPVHAKSHGTETPFSTLRYQNLDPVQVNSLMLHQRALQLYSVLPQIVAPDTGSIYVKEDSKRPSSSASETQQVKDTLDKDSQVLCHSCEELPKRVPSKPKIRLPSFKK